MLQLKSKSFRHIAIHLPQFHPIPENDEWWGKGFTEWTNVAKAQPLFEGHYQPHLPADLGFYDLRLEEAREAQAKLAQEYGIDGFCYYHYWFNGKRLLERPVDEILSKGKPDFPYMLCWANDNWTRRWDGLDQELLISHEYSPEDDVEHMKHLIKYFQDPRYIKVNNKPVFVLYKTFLLPDPGATAKRWRAVAAEFGIELYLCHMVFGYNQEWNRLVEGFDAVIDFEPFGVRRMGALRYSHKLEQAAKTRTIYDKIRDRIYSRKSILEIKKKPNIFEYKSIYEQLTPVKKTGLKMYPSLCPGWDNSARRKDDPSLILDDSTPAYFKEWYQKVATDFEPYSEQENFIFINAWNEWAEGNHLEPCRKWGRQYLEAIKEYLIS
jgi:lipopolysaccharide biosynthesis protein